MKRRDLARTMRRRNRDDVEFASMTWEQRRASIARDRRIRFVLQVTFAVGSLTFGIGSFPDIVMLFGFGILGPLALRYELL